MTITDAPDRAKTKPDVVVLDAIGGLRDSYAEGDVAVVGGTFSRRGGHTPLEAAARGCALVFGPNPGSFRTLAAELCAAGAAVAVGRDGLGDAIAALLRDEARRREMGRRAAGVRGGRTGRRRALRGRDRRRRPGAPRRPRAQWFGNSGGFSPAR